MNQDTEKELVAYFNSLPQEMQGAFRSLNLTQRLQSIPDMQPLQDNQKTMIRNEIVLTFIGLRNIPELTTNIKYSADISRDRAERIARIIERDIFIPNMSLLERTFGVKEAIKNTQETVSSAPIDGIKPGQSQPTSTTQPQRQPQRIYVPEVPGTIPEQKPQPAPQPQPKQVRGPYDPYKEPFAENEKTSVVGDTHPSTPAPHSLEVFRERLTKQVSAPVEQVILAEKKKERPAPATKEELAKDPYRETIG